MPQIVIGPDEYVVDLTDHDAKYILNTGTGQQILLDLQSLLTIASGGEAPRIVCDGQEMVIEGSPQEILSSITLCTDIDDQQSTHDILGTALVDAPGVVYPTVSVSAKTLILLMENKFLFCFVSLTRPPMFLKQTLFSRNHRSCRHWKCPRKLMPTPPRRVSQQRI